MISNKIKIVICLLFIIKLSLLPVLKTCQANQSISQFKLKNGLEVIVYPKNTTAKVAVQLIYKVGSFVEKEGQKGLAHLFEHMMFRGSKNVKDEQHTKLIQEIGGYSNAYTSSDATVYLQTIPSKHLELIFKLEADRMHYLNLNNDILNKERQVVLEEYRWRIDNNPEGELYFKLNQHLYQNHPYMYGPAGKKEDINAFTLLQCQQFYEQYYSPNNAVLVVVGDVNTKDVKKLAKKHFSKIPKSRMSKKQNLIFKPQKHKQLRVVKDTSKLPRPVTVWSYYIPPTNHADTIALNLLYNILDRDKSSRLHHHLVDKKELAVKFISYPDFSLGTGTLSFMAFHHKDNEKALQEEFFSQIEILKTEGVSAKELEKAKNQLIASRVFLSYTVDDIADHIVSSISKTGDIEYFENYLDKLEQIQTDDILRVAQQYFVHSNATLIKFEPSP